MCGFVKNQNERIILIILRIGSSFWCISYIHAFATHIFLKFCRYSYTHIFLLLRYQEITLWIYEWMSPSSSNNTCLSSILYYGDIHTL
jgi:hypothetical protein